MAAFHARYHRTVVGREVVAFTGMAIKYHTRRRRRDGEADRETNVNLSCMKLKILPSPRSYFPMLNARVPELVSHDDPVNHLGREITLGGPSTPINATLVNFQHSQVLLDNLHEQLSYIIKERKGHNPPPPKYYEKLKRKLPSDRDDRERTVPAPWKSDRLDNRYRYVKEVPGYG